MSWIGLVGFIILDGPRVAASRPVNHRPVRRAYKGFRPSNSEVSTFTSYEETNATQNVEIGVVWGG